MSVHSPLLNPDIQFMAEEESDAASRYSGYAADFYSRLYSKHPGLRGKFRFFRDAASDDIWSVCDLPERSFGVQLDPDVKVICIWDSAWFDEIGTWSADPVADAIKEIGDRYLRSD